MRIYVENNLPNLDTLVFVYIAVVHVRVVTRLQEAFHATHRSLTTQPRLISQLRMNSQLN